MLRSGGGGAGPRYGAIEQTIPESAVEDTSVHVPHEGKGFFEGYYGAGASHEHQNYIPPEELNRYWGPEDHVLDALEKSDGASIRSKFDARCCRRVCRVWKLSYIPGCCLSREGFLVFLTALLSILGMLGQTAYFVLFPMLTESLEHNSQSDFTTGMIGVLVAIVFMAVMNSSANYVGSFMAIRMRQNLSRVIHFRYLGSSTFYRMLHLDQRVDNPDQRLAEDCRVFSLSLMYIISQNSGNGLFVFIIGYLAIGAVGGIAFIAVTVFLVVGFVVTKFLMNRVVPVIFRQDRLEGDFRFAHVHLREHAESVAFYSGGDQQQHSLNFSLRRLLRNFVRLTVLRLPLGVCVQFLQATNSLLGLLIPAILFAVRGGLYGGHSITDAYGYVISYVGTLTGLLGTVSYINQIAGSGNRLGEMLEVMDDIEAQERAHVFQLASSREVVPLGVFRSGDRLALDSVTCQTPDNIELVRDITFNVEMGDSMLIMGPSGVGKSSMLRVVGGLWPIRDGGTVTRPAHVGRDGLFYLPQKAYLVLGATLRQQVVYPLDESSPASNITDSELRVLLDSVDLGHLMEHLRAREGEVDWDSVLSGGEKQRLSMARLFFHKPRFAILDECTSAVDEEMEDRFFERLRSSGMAYISVAHSARVKRFHTRVMLLDPTGGYAIRRAEEVPDRIQWTEPFFTESLTLPTQAEGFEMTSVSRTSSRHSASGRTPSVFYPVTESAAVVQEPAEVVAQELQRGKHIRVQRDQLDEYWRDQTKQERRNLLSHVEATDQAKQRAALNWRFVRRLGRLVRIMYRPCCSRTTALLGAATLFACIKAATVIMLPSFIKTVTEDMGRDRTTHSFQMYLGYLVIAMIMQAIGAAVSVYFAGLLTVEMRKKLTRYIHFRYLKGLAFYRACCIDQRIDNPDQRVAQDVGDFSLSVSGLMFGDGTYRGFVELVPELIALTAMTWFLITWRGVVMAYGLALLCFIANRFLAAPIVPLTFRQDRLEGDFRFAHVRFRTHAESIAFLNGAKVEQLRLNTLLARALANNRNLIFREYFLYMFTKFTDSLDTLGGFVLAGVVYFTIGYGGQSVQNYYFVLFNQFGTLFDVFENVLSLIDVFAVFAGRANRLGDFLEVLDDFNDQALRPTFQPGENIALDNVNVITPDGRRLARNLSLGVASGQSLLLVGPSGAGKSSVLRTVAGLWRPESGRLQRPLKVGRDGVFFLPQSPLLILGTLKQQILYPATEETANIDDEDLRSLLREVRLEHLMDRVYGSEGTSDSQPHQARWDDLLSGGEKQRLAMARLFFHKPRFAILDECTSAVDEEMESLFYTKLRKLGIAFISVAHRGTVVVYHDRVLRLSPDGTWSVTEAAR